MYTGLHVNSPLFLSDFNRTRILWTDFREILTYNSPWKSVQWGQSCSTRKDGQTEGYEGNSRFSEFCERA